MTAGHNGGQDGQGDDGLARESNDKVELPFLICM